MREETTQRKGNHNRLGADTRPATPRTRIGRQGDKPPCRRSLTVNTHVREVLNIVNNPLAARAARSDSVAQSWIRCLNEFRLDPARFVMPPVLTPQELADAPRSRQAT